MAKKSEAKAFTRRLPKKRPGAHTKPKGAKSGLTGKHPLS